MRRNGSSQPNANTQRRAWCLTINNPDAGRPDEWGRDVFDRVKARYLVFQLERGSNGTPHYQCYIEFGRGVRFSTIKRFFPKAHIEPRMGTSQQAADYCRKVDSRLDGPWEFGEPSHTTQGRRTDLHDVCESIAQGCSLREVAEQHPTSYIKYHRGIREMLLLRESSAKSTVQKKTIILIYGSSHIGKTTYVRTNYNEGLYIKSGAHKWFDGYVDQRMVLIDDFAGGKSGFMCSTLLNILDQWDCQVEIKGGMVTLRHRVLFVTTNIHPRDWYDFEGRGEHLIALKNRFTQVWTMENYKPVVIDKDAFFHTFFGYQGYQKTTERPLFFNEREEEEEAEGGEESSIDLADLDKSSSSCTTTVEFSQ